MKEKFKGEILIKTLDNIIRMLTYAETKNGLLVSFYLVVISLVNYLFEPDFMSITIILFMLPVYLGLLVALISFFPIITNVSIMDKPIGENKNFYFFGDLAKCTVKEVQEVYFIEDNNKLYLSIIEQTIINSKIVNRKFLMFKLSIYIFAVIPVLIWIANIIKNKIKEVVGL
jgi:hypothetical protein